MDVAGRWSLMAVALATLAGAVMTSGRERPERPKKIEFNRDVRPILAKSCWACHGPDPEPLKKTGNMRLDSFAGATEDRGGYRAVVPGKPEESVLLKRIADHGAMRMPPPSSGLKELTPEEVAVLRQWIAEGGEFKQHWAYVPPTVVPPAVAKSDWAKNPIDLYLLAGMQDQGLAPEAEADRATLIRRVALTLTGLPPTPKEVREFVSDRSPRAYERMVDRMLASPRYGEHQARYWLDAVRYADTHGLHIDNERAVFPYRDWVIRALNEDLPFDQFTVWQLAGDLLPNPTLDQKIATGYIRMNPTTNEGGVIEAEFLAKNTMDRVDTTATIFMAATLACAKCHDHKYDPFPQKEYYSLYAFFNSTTDPVLDGNLKLHTPVMKAPDPDQQAKKAALEKALLKLESATPPDAARVWLATAELGMPAIGKWETSDIFAEKTFDEAFAKAHAPETGEVTWKPLEFDGKPKQGVVGKENAAVYLRTTLEVTVPIKTGIRVSSDDAVKVFLDGKLVFENRVLRSLGQTVDSVPLQLTTGRHTLMLKIVNAGGGDGVSVEFGSEREVRIEKARGLLVKKVLTLAETRELIQTFLLYGPAHERAENYRRLTSDLAKLEEEIPFTYVAEELPMPRKTFVLKRGEYNLIGEEVTRDTPSVLGKMPSHLPKNRLGLAQWIVDPSNPLTARVIANRIWQQHWGEGIVASSEDFGSRGDWPTHPELLDYLAVEFVRQKWSLKKLHRLILTSAAYRQAATANPEKRNKDPYNKVYARGPRFRLDGEVVRDTALFVSGLLRERPGGRGDKPYQPSGLWEAIAYPISDTAKYVQDHGDKLYRRSVYLFWKRTSPPPTMLLFDAPMRESCVVKRSRTNTPSQALVTLNETGFVEAARAMAERVWLAAQNDADRLAYAFELTCSRKPNAAESRTLLDLLAKQRARFLANEPAAKQAVSVGESPRNPAVPVIEQAAWMVVCGAILNLDETLTLH